MKLTIKYFGLIAEITKSNEEEFEFEGNLVSELIEKLVEKYPALKQKNFQVAQNQKMVTKNSIILETEIALLPPFAGG